MADRAGGEGDPGVPKEVFELDKDERWQARLDEARARREIALREKAAGKPQKPRPKPWEVDGSDIEEPPEINPIIQERGDDKFDFADRLESIREAQDDAPAPPPVMPPKAPVSRPRATPDFNPAPKQRVPAAQASGLEPRARPQPSLILPGAPDVAELAERYAATLEVVEDDPVAQPEISEEETAAEPDATLVPLTRPAAETPLEEPRKLTRAERRRGIRPLGMALALAGFAALPFATEAPPLETGPLMPDVASGFRLEPALGVTWSLSNLPTQTQSGEWRPATAPAALATVPFSRSASVTDNVFPPPLPLEEVQGTLNWSGLAPVPPNETQSSFPPETSTGVLPQVTGAPVPPAPLVEAAPAPLPRASVSEEVPEATTLPAGEAATDLPQNTAPVSAPPRPDTLIQEDAVTPPKPPQRPEQTVVEADPLRVTILAPPRSDRKAAEELATNVQRDGHELVRVRDVDYSINERNVRFFHEQDRASAARMAERYDAELRDFTWFRPQPAEGTAELWLSGRAATEVDQTSQPAREPTPRNEEVDAAAFLGRVFERLGLSAELPENLPASDGRN